MLCHCVTPANRARYTTQIEAMYRQRHDVFVDQLGWRELRRADRRDIDAYDTEDTVYFLVLNDAGDVVASARMNPTHGRHQLEAGGGLRERFADADPPRGPHVWEASRLIGGFRDRYGRDFARETLGVLVAATHEFCARRGITLGLSIFELNATLMLQAVGLETKPLGLPVPYETDNGTSDAIAVTWAAGVRTLMKVRTNFGIVGPVLFEASPVLDEDDARLPSPALLESVSELRSEASQAELLKAAQAALEREWLEKVARGEAEARGPKRRRPLGARAN